MKKANPKQMKKVDPKQVKCIWCRKLFVKDSDMSCGATVPRHMAVDQDGHWCKTDDIKEYFGITDGSRLE
jgi:hypothetical protein